MEAGRTGRVISSAFGLLLLGALLALVGCESAGEAGHTSVTRDTLPDGTVVVRYEEPPAAPTDPLPHDLELGAMDGPSQEVFGDVRGVEVDPSGEIFVLDHQASEIRVFSPDGEYLRTLAGQGEGPGEISRANGLQRAPDGTLWVQNFGRWQMMRFDHDGQELERVPMPVLSYGYMWNGSVDDRGRIWKPATHRDGEPVRPEASGPVESVSRLYLKFLDPETEATDSVFIGEQHSRTYVQIMEGGVSVRSIPFTSGTLWAVDPAGGFWLGHGERYRIVRLDEAGDTVLVVEVDLPPEPVTASDRDRFVEDMLEDAPERRRAAEEIASLMPEAKPVIDQLFVDERSRLWARRAHPEGDGPVYDVFDREGNHVSTVRISPAAAQYFVPRIRGGHLYTLRLDELDVHKVVRVPLPEPLRDGAPTT